MTSKLTRERLQEIAEDGFLKHGESKELARIALAAMDSEPVEESVTCWSCRNEVEISAIGDRDGYCPICDAPIDLDEEPYTSPQPAPDREQVRREHAEWSQATFGNVGPVGPQKHLSKEALEAAAEPGDLSEWADMQFLMWDAQRRAGITDEQITQAMFEKLAVNKQRSWPEPKDGEPRLHIKAQPAPEKYNIGDATMRHIFTPTGMTNVSDMQAVFDRVEAVLVGMEQPAPVVPDGYVMVPMRLTAENGAKGALSGEFSETKFVNCPECFGDDECETCNGSGRIEIKVPVSWTTIKEIWIKGVEHFAAAPQENN
ncbi:DUF550 domain-containing protein [Raoultella ornithinolytica]